LRSSSKQLLLVGDAEGDVEHAFLRVVEIEQAGQQQRPHLGDGGADRVALLAENVPEHGGELIGLVFHADLLGALDEGRLGVAGRRDPREVALDVGGEDRHAVAGKTLRHHLQAHGLAGTGRAGHQAVAVGELEQEAFGFPALADQDRAWIDRDLRFRHGIRLSGCRVCRASGVAKRASRRKPEAGWNRIVNM
jgi:hypothetical protein